MKKRVFIVHGWDGYPEEGWFPWLKSELEARGFEVQIPSMPHPGTPTIRDWVAYLAKLVGEPDEQTYFVGHSIGCQAVLRYLESIDSKIGGVVLVAGWLLRLTGDLSAEEIEIARPWIETPINYSKIKANCPVITCVFSDNDPFVLLEENKKMFINHLNVNVIVEHAKGHLNGEANVTELPSARDALLKIAGF
ncbi:MAG: alpha/beta fold hydrolase [Candidatus Jorgensenbacteria bacterium]|nr:alpha/beta fold hydrolase [Candidatus Jorgensenbacteria bacterium]